MKVNWPASHVLAAIFFSVMMLASAIAAFSGFSNGQGGSAGGVAGLLLALIALAGLGTKSKWALVYCSGLLLLFPLFALFALGVIVFRIGTTEYAALLPLLIVSLLTLVLFYRFAFGKPSRDAFSGSRA